MSEFFLYSRHVSHRSDHLFCSLLPLPFVSLSYFHFHYHFVGLNHVFSIFSLCDNNYCEFFLNVCSHFNDCFFAVLLFLCVWIAAIPLFYHSLLTCFVLIFLLRQNNFSICIGLVFVCGKRKRCRAKHIFNLKISCNTHKERGKERKSRTRNDI